jgi:queuine/archaeosine tRNA-ribosyltransferase
MTTDELLAARIRKYTTDLSGAYDGCECPTCVGARHTLKELDYLRMAIRNLTGRPVAITAGKIGT